MKFGRVGLLIIALTLSTVTTAGAQELYAAWTLDSPTMATLDLDGTAGTVEVMNATNFGGSLLAPAVQDGAANYPDMWFTPTPPVGLQWLITSADNIAGGSTASADLVVTFDQPVSNPRVHFVNLDNATVDFAMTTQSGGGAAAVSLLSGNAEFEFSGAVANATPNVAAFSGCEDAMGGNPNGACGSLQLSGSYAQIVMTVTDTDVGVGSGDGFAWTISRSPVVPPAIEVPTMGSAALVVLALFLLGAATLMLRRRKQLD